MIRGPHILAIAAILLIAVALRATESYTGRYQTLPVIDWVESRPPLSESDRVPPASDLARGLSRALPLLVIRDDARPRTPVFGPPAVVQRTIGGVRDASRMVVGTRGQFDRFDAVPTQVWLDVIVFNRADRAASWAELMGREMDLRDPDSGEAESRVSGPDEPDGVWLVAPWANGGRATIAGHRGAIGFVIKVFLSPTLDDGNRVDLNARAETVARQARDEWTAWLATQVGA